MSHRRAPAAGAAAPGSRTAVAAAVPVHCSASSTTPSFVEAELRLAARDTVLVLYTDGVPEARRDGDFYGDARLLEGGAGQRRTAAAVTEELLADVLEFQGGHPRDDIAIVAVGVPPA